MLFNFSTFNHCDMGKRGLEDLTGILAAQLQALGHQVMFSDLFIPPGTDHPGINVLVEAFEANAHRAAIARMHRDGARFLYIATEEPTPLGFNHGVAPGMVARQAAFAGAAQYASAILHLVPGEKVTAWYSQFAPSAYAELGYAPSMVYAGPPVEPEFDFGFYGQVTYRRNQMLGRLQERGSALILSNLELPAAERDAQMRRVRVVVQIREHQDMPFVSSSRCATALHLGRPVVAEPHPSCKLWDQVVHFSRSEELFYADAVAATRTWPALHQAQFARFTSIFTPDFCIGKPLRDIGVLT